MKVNIIAIDQRTRAETPEGEGVELAEVIGDDDSEDILALAAEIEAKGFAMIGGGASPLCRLVAHRDAEALRRQGYEDRLAHRPNRPDLMFSYERAAYEGGVAEAEASMGFRPVS